MVAELNPCPFCGAGESRIDESTMRKGRRLIVTSVCVRHWCKPNIVAVGVWSPHIEMRAKTREQAIEIWNTRQ